MTDVFSKAKRSDVMSRIRGRNNKETELVLAKLMRTSHIKGWRRHSPVIGKPDFIFPHAKLAIFVDGCFWHQCPVHSNIPSNNRAFWLKKLRANEKRDAFVGRELRKSGWRVLRIWEHDLRKPEKVIERISKAMH